jgi:hypothetical protein
MPTHLTLGLVVYLCLSVAPALLSARTATAVNRFVDPPSRVSPRFLHDQTIVATYDSVADSTHLAVVTHKGKYFFTIQRPRLEWTATHAGRTPGAEPPAEIVLVFRTQAPQVVLDNRLIMEFAGGQRFEVASVSAYSDPGVQTWSHFMRFPIPTAALTEAVASDEVTLWVGGIQVRFKPNQVNALRELLSRVGAWPPAPVGDGA